MSPPPASAVCALAVRTLPAGRSWPRLVGGLRGRPGLWWLDSARPEPRQARFSFAGAEPFGVIRAQGSWSEFTIHRSPSAELPAGGWRRRGDPMDALRAWLPSRPERVDGEAGAPSTLPPFLGGAVGIFGYELGLAWEGIAARAGDDLVLPDLCWLLVDRLYAYDHLEDRIHAAALGFGSSLREARARAADAAGAMTAHVPDGPPPPAPAPSGAMPEPGSSLDEGAYAKAIAQVKERIVAGDVYQACLTRRLQLPFAGDPWSLYGALRQTNPAPFGAFLRLPGLDVLSSSPERFLLVDERRRVESRPIKGTRPRGADEASDRALGEALRASPKDRAENLMIVDLVRNDLGRVCELGSVHVPELMAVERYAAVHQLVSTVRGRLRQDRDALDLVRAAFPPGSMTGAPKRSAMQILAGIEPVRRNVYAGALGYLDARGGCGLAVAIRTLTVSGGSAALHTGGGIVADSEPEAEWRESADKARAVLAALARCGSPP